MNPSPLIASLLKTLGVNPQLLEQTAANLVGLAQSIDQRLARIEQAGVLTQGRLARIETHLARLGALTVEDAKTGDGAEDGKPPLIEYIEAQKAREEKEGNERQHHTAIYGI